MAAFRGMTAALHRSLDEQLKLGTPESEIEQLRDQANLLAGRIADIVQQIED